MKFTVLALLVVHEAPTRPSILFRSIQFRATSTTALKAPNYYSVFSASRPRQYSIVQNAPLPLPPLLTPPRLSNKPVRLILQRRHNNPLPNNLKPNLQKHLSPLPLNPHLKQHRLLPLPLVANPGPLHPNPLLSRRGSNNPKRLPKLLHHRPLRQPNPTPPRLHNKRPCKRSHLHQLQQFLRPRNRASPLRGLLRFLVEPACSPQRQFLIPAKRDVQLSTTGSECSAPGCPARTRSPA